MPVIKDKITYHNVYGGTYIYQGAPFKHDALIKCLVKEGYTKRHATEIVDNINKKAIISC